MAAMFFVYVLQVLYRVKEKVQISDRQLKAPPPDLHLTHSVPPKSAQGSEGTKVSRGTRSVSVFACKNTFNKTSLSILQFATTGSMVQAELPPVVATPTEQKQPIVACRSLAPPVVPLPR